MLGLDQALSPRGGDSGVVVDAVVLVVVATLVGGNAAPEKKSAMIVEHSRFLVLEMIASSGSFTVYKT